MIKTWIGVVVALVLLMLELMDFFDCQICETWTTMPSLIKYPLFIAISAYYYFHFDFLINDQEETKSQDLSKDELSAKTKERGTND